MGRMGIVCRWALCVMFVSLGACGDGSGSDPDGGGTPPDGAPPADSGTSPDGGTTCGGDEDCDNGMYCDGVERCMPGASGAGADGCVAADDGPCMASQTCDEDQDRCITDCGDSADADGDGHDSVDCGGDDCDDADPDRFPGNAEVCDEEGHDEDCDPATVGSRDHDDDGYDDIRCCNPSPEGGRLCAEDCTDYRRGVNPNNPEVCNGYDDDCDGMIDEDLLVAVYIDNDRDLHGADPADEDQCPGTPGFAQEGGDCDDGDARRHPAQVEVCDGIDNDCDMEVDEGAVAVAWYQDLDGDGYGTVEGGTVVQCSQPEGYALLPGDCDDGDPAINPLAQEICDGIDNDCNGIADFRIGPGNFEDDDDDGYADPQCPVETPDCDDEDPTVHPGAAEICDDRDNDCDGTVDGPDAEIDWYLDSDGDNYGDDGDPGIRSCEPQPGRVPRQGDCDDTDPDVHEGAYDGCRGQQGVDDDCDLNIDEAVQEVAIYNDGDEDGWGRGAPVGTACFAPAGFSTRSGDCDDGDADVRPGADEMCDPGDGIDNDCDGLVDCDDIDCDGSPNCDIDKVLEIVSGNGQSASLNRFAPTQVVIRVTDLADAPLSDVDVTLRDSRGGAGASPATVTSDGTGLARFFVRAGREVGVSRLDVTAMGARPVSVSLTATAPADDTVFTLINADHVLGNAGVPGPGSFARTGYLSGIAVASDRTVYVTDEYYDRVLRLTQAGRLEVVAGTGLGGYSGDYGPAADAQLNNPAGLALDEENDLLYIADSGNHRVRVVDLVTGVIQPFAGDGTTGEPYGDGGPAGLAHINRPRHVELGPDGALYIGDQHHQIRRVPVTDGSPGAIETVIPRETICTGGINLYSCSSYGCTMTFDTMGNLYVAASICGAETNRSVVWGIMRVAPDGTRTRVAGQHLGGTGEDIPARGADLQNVAGLAFDPGENLYYTERDNHRIRRIDGTTGLVQTVVGSGTSGFGPDGGAASSTDLYRPMGIAFLPGNHLVWTEYQNTTARQAWSYGLDSRAEAAMSIASGDMQMTELNNFVTLPLTVAIADSADDPVRGIEVFFRSLTEGADVLAASQPTDLSGEAAVGVRLGRLPGDYEIEAEAFDLLGNPIDGSPLVFTATAEAPTAGTLFTLVNADRALGNAVGVPGPGPAAHIGYVSGVEVASDGTVYISEEYYDRVYALSPSGILSVVAGTGMAGFAGDLGPADEARLSNPGGLALDEAGGFLYIADRSNHRVRVVDLMTGQIETFAGDGTSGTSPYGDGGPPDNAQIYNPRWVSLGPDNAIYIADNSHNRIRRVDLSTNVISTLIERDTCGSATTVFYDCDQGCAMRWDGTDLVFTGRLCGTDTGTPGNVVQGVARLAMDGTLTHVSGYYSGSTDDGSSASMTAWNRVSGLAMDAMGHLYVADYNNHVVRRIDAGTGLVETVAGTLGMSGNSGDYGSGTEALLFRPVGLDVQGGEHVIIGEYSNYDVRVLW